MQWWRLLLTSRGHGRHRFGLIEIETVFCHLDSWPSVRIYIWSGEHAHFLLQLSACLSLCDLVKNSKLQIKLLKRNLPWCQSMWIFFLSHASASRFWPLSFKNSNIIVTSKDCQPLFIAGVYFHSLGFFFPPVKVIFFLIWTMSTIQKDVTMEGKCIYLVCNPTQRNTQVHTLFISNHTYTLFLVVFLGGSFSYENWIIQYMLFCGIFCVCA